MKSKFITDPQDPSDSFGFLDTAGAEVYANLSFPAASFSLSTTQDVGSPPSSNPVEIPSTPALTSEAAEASGAQIGPISPVSLTSGGITINLLFDAAAMAAPASFRAGIQQAAALLTTAISDKITLNIKIDYSGIGGGAAAGPDNGLYESYTSVRADLINNATPGDTTFNALPSGSSFQGQSNVAIWNAQLKLWGLLGANDTTTDDGSATFATDINSNLLVGVALHELTHAMGRVPYGPPYGAQPDIFDFYRFTSPGTRLISGSSTAGAAYFSVDGGNTKLADYGQTSDPADFLNSGVQGPNDPFNEFYNGSTIQSLSTVDKQQLDALGFHTSAVALSDLTEYVSMAATTIAAGATTTVDAYAINRGVGTSGLSTAGIYLSTDANITTSDTLLATVDSSALSPNGVTGYVDHHAVSVTLPANLAPGTYYIGGIADYNNQLVESNEGNNASAPVQITVTGPALPDLTEYVSMAATMIAAGATTTVDAYAINRGVGTSGLSTAGIYLSTDANITTSDTLLATVDSSALSPNGVTGYVDHHAVSVTLPANLAPGTYYIGGIADYNNQLVESNEGNNASAPVQITVTGPALPDLTEYVSMAATMIAAGATTTVDACAINRGVGTSGLSTAGIYLSTDANITTSDTLLATVDSSALSPNGVTGYVDHHAVSVTLPANLAPGTYYIGGIADYNNQLVESNESNNASAPVQITVTGPALPDLTEYVSMAATMIAAGATTTVDAYAINRGVGTSGLSTAGIYLSTDANITTSDTLLATVDSSALSPNGVTGYVDHHAVSVTLPANLAPGTYYIGGIADYNNHLVESNESNNASDPVQITVTAPLAVQTTSLTSTSGNDLLIGSSGSDTFVFAPNFGQNVIKNFDPHKDTIQIDHAVFSDVGNLIAHTSDNSSGNAVIVANAHDTITIVGVTTDALEHHLNDFIIT